MTLISEMDLPYMPATSPAFDENPMGYIKEARLKHPWLAKMDEGYIVHGYQAIKDFSIMDDKCGPLLDGVVDIYGATDTKWGHWMSNHLLALHGPEHTRIKSSIGTAFTPAAANRFRNRMRDRINELLDEWLPKGEFDFYEFITNYPISVLCTVLGTDNKGVTLIKDFLEAQGQVFSLRHERLPELLGGFDTAWNYVDDLIKDREKNGPNNDGSLLDSLIATKNTGQINDWELRSLLMVLFPGGYDTSRNTLTLITYTMLDYPEYWEKCGEDKAFAAKVVEEMFRFNSVAPPIRKVIEEFEYDGVLMPKDTRLFLLNPLASRDPQSFPDADKFDPERVSDNRHLAFGRGAHICPGQHLARALIVEALHTIAQRMKRPRLVGEVKWRAFLGVCGPAVLPIAFEAEPARVH